MIVQSIILPNKICSFREIYIRTSGNILLHADHIDMDKGAKLNTATYMNIFDAGTWLRYTGIQKWTLIMRLSGKGTIRLIQWKKDKTHPLLCMQTNSNTPQTIVIPFEHKEPEGMYYFEIEATSEIKLLNAFFTPEKNLPQRNVRLGLVICTYHRQKELFKNLQEIKTSKFFDRSDELYGKLHIYIVDNASELPLQTEDFITVYHNPNTGGSGGFTRGIEEICKDKSTYEFTHVIFMDDDVEVLAETFHRLHALLSLVKQEYQQEVVAGRMFRMDQRQTQYTAAEIWNGGNLLHVGWNLDMTDRMNLVSVNDNNGAQYSGWWFASFPMQFVEKNTPLPFFLHCDDVEYGLRHGGTPIILNGIQVWHETYEYRQSPVIAYYDMRNSLIVNELYGYMPIKHNPIEWWRMQKAKIHNQTDKRTRHMMVLGLWDFFKGINYLKKIDSANKHKLICSKAEKRKRG